MSDSREPVIRPQSCRQLLTDIGVRGWRVARQPNQDQPGGRTATQLLQQQFRYRIGARNKQGQISYRRRRESGSAAGQHR